jgi:hypothetical protein
MARQATDVVALDEVAPLDYRFAVRGRRYRIHFVHGAWILDEFGDRDVCLESMEVGSLVEGVNWALEEN